MPSKTFLMLRGTRRARLEARTAANAANFLTLFFAGKTRRDVVRIHLRLAAEHGHE
jgi:hypothetical protein